MLVGAGPGDPELLTLKAVRALARADAVVHDRLVSEAVLGLVPARARRIAVGKASGDHSLPQDQINDMLVGLARQGLTVLRLKGGDPFIFGRGGEEAAALRAEGIPVEIVPGITAAQGAAAALGVPLTHRGLATGVRYVAGHCRSDLPLALDWQGLADPETTLVIYMGAAAIGGIAAELMAHGLPAATPALAVSAATTPGERRVASRLGRLAADAAGLASPVLFIVGRVACLPDVGPSAHRLAGLAAEPAHA
jgi:uroporphyrin-III C-methyltransferase